MFLKKFDHISPSLTLHYNSQHSHLSKFGGLLTIISYLLCLLVSCYFFNDVLYRKNPVIYYYNRVISEAGYYPMNSKSMFHYIYIGDPTNKKKLDNYFQVIGFSNLYVTNYNENGNRENFDHYIYDKCSEDLDDLSNHNIKDILNFSEFHLSYCISSFYNHTSKQIISVKDKNFPVPSVEHGASNPHGTYYGVFIQKCINSTILNIKYCETPENMDTLLNNTNIMIAFIILNNEIMVENYKNPFKHSLFKVTSGILNYEFTVNHLNFQPLSMITHDGFFINSKKEDRQYSYELNEKNTFKTETGIVSSFFIWMQNKNQIYERIYKRIPNVIGDISGAIKIIIIITSWINYINYYHILYKDIDKVINLYNFDKEKNISNNKNNFLSLNIKESKIYKNNEVLDNTLEHTNNFIENEKLLNLNNKKQLKKSNFGKKKYFSKISTNYFQQYNKNNNILNNLIKFKEYSSNDYKFIDKNFKKRKREKDDIKNESRNLILSDFLKKPRKTKKKFYILNIKKYYEKIISEEELFYLYFDVYTIKLNEKKIIQKMNTSLEKIEKPVKLNKSMFILKK